jgi:predicted alpha/beta superfamily hydrolase
METVASQSESPYQTETQGTPLAPELVIAKEEGRYIRFRNWESRFLPSSRDLFIYLPKAYFSEPERRFPVLLLHDGQNLIDGSLSYVKGSTWNIGTTADAEIASGRVEPTVLVGVANTGPQRIAEYTPTPDRRLGGGKGPLYARLLVDELLPMLRDEFRILPNREAVGVAGSSLGGLISLSIGLRYPDTFSRIGVLSPSIWWDNRTILRDVRALHEHLPLRIWLDIGTGEGLRHIRDTDLMAKLLIAKGWREGHDLMYHRIPAAQHNEAAWAARFGQVLRFLFPSQHLG